jgi:hypothetical protein
VFGSVALLKINQILAKESGKVVNYFRTNGFVGGVQKEK